MAALWGALFGGAPSPQPQSGPVDSRSESPVISSNQDVESIMLDAQQPEVETQVVKAEGLGLSKPRGGNKQVASNMDATEVKRPVSVGSRIDTPLGNHSPTPVLPPQTKLEAPSPVPTLAPSSSMRGWLLPVAYGLTNLTSVVMIVLANKIVLYTYKFSFAVTLTWLHCIFTAVGMAAMAAAGVFTPKRTPLSRTLPVACVYVGFIVFNNLSIQLNTVGFYQVSKIAITPVVVAIEFLAYHKKPSGLVLCSTAVLLLGIFLATVSDSQVSRNPLGMCVALVNVLVTGLYQVWAGTKQKELGLNGNQLLHQVAPSAVVLLAILIPALEPVGFTDSGPGTVLGYTFTPPALAWILASSVLGLVVTLSTFLFIGATSSLTYNVVGHLKTVVIVACGVMLFGDEMTARKLGGLACAMGGIIWYTHIKIVEAGKTASS